MKQNEKLKREKKPLKMVPPSDKALTKEELKEFKQKERAYEKAFYQNLQIKKQMTGSARK